MRVAIHQPDLLPYSGFWFKMVESDLFAIAAHDQFQKHGYQRRVAMRDRWCSHQLVGKPSLIPISSVMVVEGWQERICATIRGRYTGARHYRTRGLELVERIGACTAEHLHQVNLAMIEVVREMLEITTPMVVVEPPETSGTQRLIDTVTALEGTEYLSGSGGAAYMGDDAAERFAAAGIELRWSTHRHLTGDSIVTVLLDHDDPLAVIRQRA